MDIIIRTLLAKVEIIKEDFTHSKENDGDGQINSAAEIWDKLYVMRADLENHLEEVEIIHLWQDIMEVDLTNFSMINKILVELIPLCKLWNMTFEWRQKKDDCIKSPFS